MVGQECPTYQFLIFMIGQEYPHYQFSTASTRRNTYRHKINPTKQNFMPNPFKIAVLISGGGTTLKNLIEYKSRGELDVEISLVVSNKSNAGGLSFAKEASIPTEIVSHKDHDDVATFSQTIFSQCRDANIDLVVMGGFLRRVKIPEDFCNRVINIHPSLIPAFCGKGNYGSRVHQAVIEYGCKISGCTVHYVDDQYDHGPIVAQETVPVLDEDSAAVLAARVFEKECELYPKVIDAIANGKVTVDDRRVSVNVEKISGNDID